ncbi:MAG: type II toxin-antitoxin system Phd/YefM family antitoxin [Rhizobiales bacterium]|nr:type II toxin-antitoxin system Phd/YefM family antitoxin [Hyphomicrobiales bacterium]
MAEEFTPTITVKASEARQHFSEIVNRVHETGERVVIEKNGAAVAAIVSRKDLRDLRRLDERRARSRAALDDLRADFEGIPEDELERSLQKALAEVREEMREERRTRMKPTALAS